MGRDDHEEEPFEEESDSTVSVEQAPPCIYEGSFHSNIPPSFDAVTIEIDGCVSADLNWKESREKALEAVEQGYKILWDMDLGLFDKLAQPLTNQGQFLSLALSLEHFRDSLWKEFKNSTLGVSLYRGAADFSSGFAWDFHQEENFKSWVKENCILECTDLSHFRQSVEGEQLIRLFCRDVAVEFLSLLAARLPDTLTAYLFLDATSFAASLSHEMQYFNPERFDRFHLALKKARLPFESIGWGSATSWGYSGGVSTELPLAREILIGVSVPPMTFYQSIHYGGFEEALSALQKHALPYKLIAENRLTAQWDGLDYLIYCPSGLSPQGKRKLQGFCAAGGIAVTTGELTGLPQEIRLHEWLRKYA